MITTQHMLMQHLDQIKDKTKTEQRKYSLTDLLLSGRSSFKIGRIMKDFFHMWKTFCFAWSLLKTSVMSECQCPFPRGIWIFLYLEPLQRLEVESDDGPGLLTCIPLSMTWNFQTRFLLVGNQLLQPNTKLVTFALCIESDEMRILYMNF